MNIKLILPTIFTLLFMSACTKAPTIKLGELYPKMYELQPKSILIMPAQNLTTAADASKLYSKTNLPIVIKASGYEVYPIAQRDAIFDKERITNPKILARIKTQTLGEIFGVDAILYPVLISWDTSYAGISASTVVDINFTLKAARSGEVIWTGFGLAYKGGGGYGCGSLIGLVLCAAEAALASSASYETLADEANQKAFIGLIPKGPLSSLHLKDRDVLVRDNLTIMERWYYSYKDGKLYLNTIALSHPNNIFRNPRLCFNCLDQVIGNKDSIYDKKLVDGKMHYFYKYSHYDGLKPFVNLYDKKVFLKTKPDGKLDIILEDAYWRHDPSFKDLSKKEQEEAKRYYKDRYHIAIDKVEEAK